MILWLYSLLAENELFSFLSTFEYISVRAVAALMVAFVVSVFMGNRVIGWLSILKFGQHIRDDQGDGAISLKEMHAEKVGTPTMGGLLMLGAIAVAAILFGDWSAPVFRLAVGMTLGFAAIGFIDDYRKISAKNSDGLSGKAKLVAQGALAIYLGAAILYLHPDLFTYQYGKTGGADLIALPFFKDLFLHLGILYIPFAMLVLMSTSNGVNLTDGLDGLATGVTISATVCFLFVAYAAGRSDWAEYLIIPHVSGGGELVVLLSALVGACFGFLWFNGYPARVFMGDTGSMMIGGLLGSVALLLKQEFLLLIVGGVFVAETMSVIIQVTSYKWRQKRIFLMSPLHHHYEKKGMPESRIILRFWIVSALLALAGLGSLKIR